MNLQKYLALIALPILACSVLPVVPFASAQDNAKEASEQVDEKDLPLAQQIEALLKEQNPVAARKALQEAIKAESGETATESQSIEYGNLHQKIAFSFYRKGEYGEATKELATSFDSALEAPDTRRKPFRLAGIAQTMNLFGARGGKQELVAEKIDLAIEHIRETEAENKVEVQVPLSNLIVMRARLLSPEEKSSARDMLVKQIESVDAINATDEATEQTIAAEFRLLAAAGSLLDNFDDGERMAKLFESSREAFPDSDSVLNEFANAEYSAISNLARNNPLEAAERLESTLEKLSPHVEDNDNLKRIIARIRSIERRIAATVKQQKLIGKPAPELQIDAWANTDNFNVDDLNGKVVLYDFWAVWCGPCIATFPHLREWREEFGDEGFEIVGITRYYNYEWDEEAGKASRSKEEVDPSVEHDAVAKFLQSKDMQHPTIFTPKDSTLQSEYGVTGIPHAVLIDREGNVQMIKVGSGQANADALHKKIEELIQN